MPKRHVIEDSDDEDGVDGGEEVSPLREVGFGRGMEGDGDGGGSTGSTGMWFVLGLRGGGEGRERGGRGEEKEKGGRGSKKLTGVNRGAESRDTRRAYVFDRRYAGW